VGPGKRWPELRYAELAKKLTGEGCEVWVVGGPGEKQYAQVISANGRFARDLTSNDLRNGILQLAAVNVAVSNDSGLMHIAAAIGTPTVGLFGPTSPWHWAPLNPISAIIEAPWRKPGDNDVRNRTTEDIPVDEVFAATMKALK
jgi:heptosyltransferase-2